MSYRSNYNVSPWQQRTPSYAMGGYSQGYNDYGGYGWGENFPMSQMGRMGYEDMQPLHYQQKGRPARNQMSPRRKPMQGKRPPPRSPASGPPSKRPNYGGDRQKRNRNNDQRRRYSRSGSKKHGGKQSSDRDSRDDSSESTYEDYECLDSEKEEMEVTEVPEAKMEINGIDDEKPSVKADEEKEGAKVDEKQISKPDDKKDAHKKEEKKTAFACHVCKIMSSTAEKYDQHIITEDHKTKVEAALVVFREKKQPSEADSKDSKNQKRNAAKSDNWCTLCEMAFNGSFLSHRSSNDHKKQRDRKYPRCRPCSKGFSSPTDFWDHCKSEEHRKTSAEFYYLKKLVVGSDDDEAALQPVPVEVIQEVPEADKGKEKEDKEIKEEKVIKDEKLIKDEKVETDDSEAKTKEDGDKTETKSSEENSKDKKTVSSKKGDEKLTKPPEPEAKGTSFVIEVDGFYCKLCRKFFRDGNVAKRKHCYSVMHYEAYKKAMESAFKDEEERQKIAEENHKAELEAAEVARRATDIAIIQKEARVAAKREAAEKKKAALETELQKASEETKKSDEEEKKSSEAKDAVETTQSELEKKAVEEQAVKDSGGPDKQESSGVEKMHT